MDHLAALQAAVDAALTDRRRVGYYDDAWLQPARRWSAAIWERARGLGPLLPGPTERAMAERVADCPLFICGAPRSGTTLMRDLLDGHPAIATLPSEGRYFGNWEARLAGRPDDWLAPWTREWLERLANPINQPPYWLLGEDPGVYVEFARAMAGWSEALTGADAPRLPLITLALAFATRQADAGSLRYWADKTPGYEIHLDAIWSHFPRARVIAMLRRPEAVAASHVAGIAQSGLRGTPTHRMLRNIARSHAALRRAAVGGARERLLVISYERLVADRATVMAEVADFLETGWDPALSRQTILGHDAEPNTSFFVGPRTGFTPASLREYFWLSLANRRHRRLREVVQG